MDEGRQRGSSRPATLRLMYVLLVMNGEVASLDDVGHEPNTIELVRGILTHCLTYGLVIIGVVAAFPDAATGRKR